ncbi:MAG: hypothetical protein CME70_18235 [Halobacteriovorax sp.]|nr:hypothetical protein [Halobacteriovorax sp.]|tara:strand:+ start:7202 stop:7900 length:699 start_codon:yes stop_codon:yes gene_type:complete
MGTLTLSQIRDDLKIALENRTDILDSQLNRWINEGYEFICQPEVRKHRELEANYDITLATDTNSYSISKSTVGYDILGIRDVTFYDATTITNTTTRHDVRPRSIQWFNKRTLYATSGGPRHFYVGGDEINFSPVTTSTDNGKKVRLSVWRSPTLLSADSDLTVLNTYFDTAVILAATWVGQFRLGYRELAIATRQELQTYMNQKTDTGQLGGEDTNFEAQIENELYLEISPS